MDKVYFYAPDSRNHYLFEQDSQAWLGISNNFTFWIVRTYLALKNVGFPCEIVNQIPKKGILFADRDTLGNKYPYLGETMLICAKGDREFHSSAHLHVVQNPVDIQKKNSLWNPFYIPPWPQPALIPRAIDRGSRVENIAFIGTRHNLTKEFLSEKWINSLKEIDCQWYPIFDKNKWNDYSNIDIIIAVRGFNKSSYDHKPASKLINCWRGLVPAILAPESAYLSISNSELDFLIVTSLEETIEAVKKLKNNPQLYLSMIENGKQRSREFSDEKITEKWVQFFNQEVFTTYKDWLKMSDLQRRYLFVQRYLKLKQMRLKNRIIK